MKAEIEKARKYLSEQGYGAGSNFSTGLVAALMVGYTKSLTTPDSLPSEGEAEEKFIYDELFKRNKKALDFLKEIEKLSDSEINSIAPIRHTKLNSKTVVGIADLMTEFAQLKSTPSNEGEREETCIVFFQNKPYNNIIFDSVKRARNYIKMQNSTRKFKEIEDNVFVCRQYGSTYKIIQLTPQNK